MEPMGSNDGGSLLPHYMQVPSKSSRRGWMSFPWRNASEITISRGTTVDDSFSIGQLYPHLICTSKLLPISASCSCCPPLNLLPNELLQTCPHCILTDDLRTRLFDKPLCLWRVSPLIRKSMDGETSALLESIMVVLVIQCCLAYKRST